MPEEHLSNRVCRSEGDSRRNEVNLVLPCLIFALSQQGYAALRRLKLDLFDIFCLL